MLLYQGRDGSTGGVLCFNADRATNPAAAKEKEEDGDDNDTGNNNNNDKSNKTLI